MTQARLRPIFELVEDDLVLADNEETGRIELHPITAMMDHLNHVIIKLKIDGETLETTADHPF